jgi:hypothetical protein
VENHKKPRRCCMICGTTEHLLREAGICLCSRCVGALGHALAEKLGLPAWDEDADVPPREGI